MKLFNFVLLAALLSFAAACGKDNKSGGGGSSSSISPINIGQPANQSVAQLKSQLRAKSPSAGLVAMSIEYVFYRTSVNANNGSWWIFDYTTYSSQSVCDTVRVNNLSNLSIAVKTGNCSYSSNPYTTATYLGLNDPNLKEFLDLPEGLIASNGVRAGKVYYQGQQYYAYSVLTLNNEQYVVSPAMPLMLNPVMKKNLSTGDTEGVVGAQISIY